MPKSTVLKGILILVLVQAFFLGSFRMLVFNQQYYGEAFQESGTYQRVQDADSTAGNLIAYFKGETGLEKGSFNSREEEHLEDVKQLVNATISYFYILCFMAVLGLFAFRRQLREIAKALLVSGGIVIFISTALYMANSYFPQLFNAFHRLFFKPGTYIFSESEMLIRLFPEAFFRKFAYDIVLGAAVLAALSAAIGILILIGKKYLNKAR